jgi:cytochrome c
MMRRILLALISGSWILLIIGSAFLLPHALGAAGPVHGNPTTGKALFEKRCTGCHSLDKNKEGPRLGGVYGRKAASVPDFSYSSELKASQITWNRESLDRWLTNPDVMVPDSDMAFHVSNPRERADIIQFLRISSGK